jgi:hypothetical protein
MTATLQFHDSDPYLARRAGEVACGKFEIDVYVKIN